MEKVLGLKKSGWDESVDVDACVTDLVALNKDSLRPINTKHADTMIAIQ